MPDLTVVPAAPADADAVVEVIRSAYAAREPVEPPTGALDETAESVAAALTASGGLVCRLDDELVGAVLFADSDDADGALVLRRLATRPGVRNQGVGTALVAAAEHVAGEREHDSVQVSVRSSLPQLQEFWRRRGYGPLPSANPEADSHLTLAKALPVRLEARTADDTEQLGRALAAVCRAGDVLLLTGELGAGKTTFTRGLAAGLQVRGDVTSPTFVISRVHPSTVDGPGLVHVDAYRLGDEAELDDLDLDLYVDTAVTVVEWGEGIAEALSPERLHVHLSRRTGDDGDPAADETVDVRTITLTPVGGSWAGRGLRRTVLDRPSLSAGTGEARSG